MNKYELIDSVIVSLNDLTVQGVRNMRIVLEATAKLAGLKDGMKQTDQQIEEKLKRLEALETKEDETPDA